MPLCASEPRRAPPCTHNFGTCALATARSGADDSQLSERISSRRCSEGRQAWEAGKGEGPRYSGGDLK
eukprot:4515805-Prymnesium_polylepis.1